MQGRANAFRMFVVIGHCCSPEVRKQKNLHDMPCRAKRRLMD
jgi:hypothetical protein